MDSINIKPIDLSDIVQLQTIGKQTFIETFAEVNAKENMETYLAKEFTTEKLTEELINPNSRFYFAMLNDKVIGYLKLNFSEAQTELKNNNTLEIERIYVLKEFHGKQVGQLLYNQALIIATQTKAHYVWLGVWEENPRAISFYKKNGFVEFDKHIFKLGADEQTDIMMKLVL